ncbi:MAG: sensor histidine kinase, partial [Verrucomicrobiota bacterium]
FLHGQWRREPPEWIMLPAANRPSLPPSAHSIERANWAVLFHFASAGWPRVPYGAEHTRYYEDVERGDAGGTALRSDSTRVSRRHVIRNEAGTGATSVFTFYLPVYHQSLLEESHHALSKLQGVAVAARESHRKGLIFASFSMEQVLQSVFGAGPNPVEFEIFSSRKPRRSEWLNDGRGAMRFGDPSHKPYFSRVERMPWYGDSWSVYFYTTPVFEAASLRYRPWLAVIIGLPISFLMAGITWVQARGRAKAERLAESLRRSEASLQVALKEREQISRDLHDGTIQSIYAAGLGLNRCRELLRRMDLPAAEAQLNGSLEQLNAAVVELRQFILSLEAEVRRGLQLDQVLPALIERLRKTTDAELELSIDPSAVNGLEPSQTIHLLNIAREALSNSLRHAQPRRVKVHLTRQNGTRQLRVQDDGMGFTPGKSVTGLGLRNLASRAAEIPAQLKIDSAPNAGTIVSVEWSDK